MSVKLAFVTLFTLWQLFLFVISLTTIISTISVSGFKQELLLYEEDGDGYSTESDSPLYKFSFGVPDPSFLPPALLQANIKNVCCQGLWALYLAEDYQDRFILLGSMDQNSLTCLQMDTTEVFPVASFRHLGPSETTVNSLTLYPGPGFEGEEHYISLKEGYDVDVEETKLSSLFLESTGSIVSTGNVSWTLFEGDDFTGRSICYNAPFKKGFYFNATEDAYVTFGLATIGSVMSTCDPVAINAKVNSLK